ncbi:MAG: class I SAM-dependent methyltransferase [Vicinamibacterales bacterium]
MSLRAERFDPESVRAEWDAAAPVYTAGQRSGRDCYRYALFGPAQVALCGDVRGSALLDIGCGNGYFSRAMASAGARVTGLDLSPVMIEYARQEELREPLGVEYHVTDARLVGTLFPDACFDMVTSCLALQDMPEPQAVLGGVRRVLKPGGRFVHSIAHPCTDTPFRRWQKDEAGQKQWLCIDRYFDCEPLQYQWSGWPGGTFTTSALHVPLEQWFAWFHEAGFHLRAFREPRPSAEAVDRYPELEDAARVPYFILFDLEAR